MMDMLNVTNFGLSGVTQNFFEEVCGGKKRFRQLDVKHTARCRKSLKKHAFYDANITNSLLKSKMWRRVFWELLSLNYLVEVEPITAEALSNKAVDAKYQAVDNAMRTTKSLFMDIIADALREYSAKKCSLFRKSQLVKDSIRQQLSALVESQRKLLFEECGPHKLAAFISDMLSSLITRKLGRKSLLAIVVVFLATSYAGSVFYDLTWARIHDVIGVDYSVTSECKGINCKALKIEQERRLTISPALARRG